jgi:hypothetical protein
MNNLAGKELDPPKIIFGGLVICLEKQFLRIIFFWSIMHISGTGPVLA